MKTDKKKNENNEVFNFLNEIDIQDEKNENEQFFITEASSLKVESKEVSQITRDVSYIKIHSEIWYSTLDRYLNSVEYAFDKGHTTGRKVYSVLSNIPEPTSKKFVLRFTLLFALLVVIIFLTSCSHNTSTGSDSHSALAQDIIIPKQDLHEKKGEEQLYIKREQLSVQAEKQIGSHTGSLWADTPSPRDLSTESRPSHIGETITILLPNKEKTFRFEIISIDPTGNVYLRGIKSFYDESGEQKTLIIVAKIPKRNLTSYQISASELSQIGLTEISPAGTRNYSSHGWDEVISRRVSDYTPDLNPGQLAAEKERKDQQETDKLKTAEKTDESKPLTSEKETLQNKVKESGLTSK